MEPYFFKWEESKYPLDEHSESHYGSIDISINEIDLIPAVDSTSVPTYIYVSGETSVIGTWPGLKKFGRLGSRV